MLWLYSGGLVLTVFLAGRIVLSSLFGRPNLACLCRHYPVLWSRTLLRWAGVEVELEGFESLDWNRPMVVIANHQSWFDVFALTAFLPAKLRFVAKEELGRIPLFGRAWQACGHVSVNRSDRSEAISSLERAASRIREEALAVIFFPEGTRSPDGRLQSFKKGAFVLAIQTGVPVVPLGISGSRKVMPKGSFRVRPGTIRIKVGRPIPTAELDHSERNQLLEESHEAVARLMVDVGAEPEKRAGAHPIPNHDEEESR